MRTILLQKSVETKCLTNEAYVKLRKHSATNNSMLLLSSRLPYLWTITFELKWQMAVGAYYFICFSHMWGILSFLLAFEQLGRNVHWHRAGKYFIPLKSKFVLKKFSGTRLVWSMVVVVDFFTCVCEQRIGSRSWYKKASMSYKTSFWLCTCLFTRLIVPERSRLFMVKVIKFQIISKWNW